MKTHSIRSVLATVVLLAACDVSIADTTYTYELQPGSTITPVFGADPIGPAEPLSGTFQWPAPDDGGNLWIFNAVALSFFSPSFTLTLDDPPTDNEATSVFKSTATSFFAENVFATGLSISQGYISSHTTGTYLGPADLPTFLTYTNVQLVPNGGGFFAASLNFTAALVPEPSSLFLGLCGSVFLPLAVAGRWKITGARSKK